MCGFMPISGELVVTEETDSAVLGMPITAELFPCVCVCVCIIYIL